MPGIATSVLDPPPAFAQEVDISDDTLAVHLTDGRSILVPLAWYPRLFHATRAERDNWRLIGQGQGIHWPDVDEDISVAALLAGRCSHESVESFGRWLTERNSGLGSHA